MTGTEIALAAEADCIQEIRKAKKEKEIKEKYEAELAALRIDSSFPHLGPISSPLSGGVSGLSNSQLPPTDSGLSSPIHVLFSDSDSEVKDISFDVTPKLPFPTPQQSGRTCKTTKNWNHRRDAKLKTSQSLKDKKLASQRLT